MRNKGKPSGINKSEGGTGTPSNINDGKMGKDNKITRQYTDEDRKLADHVRTKNPNRNVDKPKATNIHGYRG